ncbi:hypothetical protein AB5J55_33680 [Streptomyces sp. R11]|uniref:Uncharacterized protein n=1 Tax=Streptomyces sp. R11 TaxID=3238625 RepID=A0AB39N9T6_9ACTN
MALLAACSGATTGTSASGGKSADAADLRLTPTTPQAAEPVAAVNWLLEDEPDSLDLDTQGGSAGRSHTARR